MDPDEEEVLAKDPPKLARKPSKVELKTMNALMPYDKKREWCNLSQKEKEDMMKTLW